MKKQTIPYQAGRLRRRNRSHAFASESDFAKRALRSQRSLVTVRPRKDSNDDQKGRNFCATRRSNTQHGSRFLDAPDRVPALHSSADTRKTSCQTTNGKRASHPPLFRECPVSVLFVYGTGRGALPTAGGFRQDRESARLLSTFGLRVLFACALLAPAGARKTGYVGMSRACGPSGRRRRSGCARTRSDGRLGRPSWPGAGAGRLR